MGPEFATRWNLDAIEAAYQQWQDNPNSVDDSWQLFFEGFALGMGRSKTAPKSEIDSEQAQASVIRLIQAYRDLGHFQAHLDPLSEKPDNVPQLDLSEFILNEGDLEKSFHPGNFLGLQNGTLHELIRALQKTYCRTIGVEYLHIQDLTMRRWLQERMEPCLNQPYFDRPKKLSILKALHYAETFERFLHTEYIGQKRFSLEGAETLIPMLEAIVERAPESGAKEIVLGMAHRGRLNVLANTLRKPYQEIFAEFEDTFLPFSLDGDGDVKYHLGFSSQRTTESGKEIHLSLTPNPSHLEAVNPVVEGRVRAKQSRFRDNKRELGIPLLIHGDAAFAGQGLVAETLNLSQLTGYATGGTIHIIINNQIGFTTLPSDARSTTYCTDVAKMIQAPIFHVNGEDPESAIFVAELALDFRQEFHRDVVIDLLCYRRHGHNEGDEPEFTQPLMMQKIKERPSLTEIYTEKLIMEGELTTEEETQIVQQFEDKLEQAQDEISSSPPQFKEKRSFGGHWEHLSPKWSFDNVDTSIDEPQLREIAERTFSVPESFAIHPKIQRQFEQRLKLLHEDKPLDWAFAELLAFGSLLLEGTHVRLSGQDSRRGTFSQRHSAVFDIENGETYVPLNHLKDGQATFSAYNSLLSEAAVLGFEYGYSLDAPEALVMWEAQFGDFANGAQVIIDQFIAAGYSKWQRDSGVVLLLPHGYEGQGPEHSSARLERFLQLCAENNMQVCYPSTPAQYFHLLRRQVKRNFRKPLIVMTPKSLLRLKAATSPHRDFSEVTFQEILDDSAANVEKVKRVILCSGKVYYDLVAAREEHVALIRVEQVYPLHRKRLKEIVQRYEQAKEWVWAQEESQNMGAWSFIAPQLREILEREIAYVGRDASASPATGSHRIHKREQQELIEAAISGEIPHLVKANSKGEM